jgi:hypothetical protein
VERSLDRDDLRWRQVVLEPCCKTVLQR